MLLHWKIFECSVVFVFFLILLSIVIDICFVSLIAWYACVPSAQPSRNLFFIWWFCQTGISCWEAICVVSGGPGVQLKSMQNVKQSPLNYLILAMDEKVTVVGLIHHLWVISYKLNSLECWTRISFQQLEYLGRQRICNNYNKNVFSFRFLVNFFSLSSFMHSAFQDLRRYSPVYDLGCSHLRIPSWCVVVTEANNSVA